MEFSSSTFSFIRKSLLLKETFLDSAYNYIFTIGPCTIPTEFSTIYNGDLHQFDPVRKEWIDLSGAIITPAPAGRCGMGFVAGDDRLLMFGGCTNTSMY